MLEIVQGSLDHSKEVMKKTLSITKQNLSNLKKVVKPKERTKMHKQQIKEMEALVNFFRVSRMQPVYIDSICINYMLYVQLMKKLKNYQVEEFIADNKLVISYSNKSTKGRFELYDITDKLQGLNFFPKAVIR